MNLDSPIEMGDLLEKGQRDGVSCGTPACVAGWAVFLDESSKSKKVRAIDLIDLFKLRGKDSSRMREDEWGESRSNERPAVLLPLKAAKILNLNSVEAYMLFRSDWPHIWYDNIDDDEPLMVPLGFDPRTDWFSDYGEFKFVSSPDTDEAISVLDHL